MNQERTMRFILDNLAAVSAAQQHAEARSARQIKAIQTLMQTGMKLIVRLEKGQKELQKGHRELQAEMKGLASAQTRMDEALTDLAASQKRTDQKSDRWLDSLKNGSNGHHGHKKR